MEMCRFVEARRRRAASRSGRARRGSARLPGSGREPQSRMRSQTCHNTDTPRWFAILRPAPAAHAAIITPHKVAAPSATAPFPSAAQAQPLNLTSRPSTARTHTEADGICQDVVAHPQEPDQPEIKLALTETAVLHVSVGRVDGGNPQRRAQLRVRPRPENEILRPARQRVERPVKALHVSPGKQSNTVRLPQRTAAAAHRAGVWLRRACRPTRHFIGFADERGRRPRAKCIVHPRQQHRQRARSSRGCRRQFFKQHNVALTMRFVARGRAVSSKDEAAVHA
eukprot:scaffold4769_cov133-Isochrysis_galbana.AAC.4